jgi:hypothetical protein
MACQPSSAPSGKHHEASLAPPVRMEQAPGLRALSGSWGRRRCFAGLAGNVLPRDLGDILGYLTDGLRRRIPGWRSWHGHGGREIRTLVPRRQGQRLVSPPPEASRRGAGASLV